MEETNISELLNKIVDAVLEERTKGAVVDSDPTDEAGDIDDTVLGTEEEAAQEAAAVSEDITEDEDEVAEDEDCEGEECAKDSEEEMTEDEDEVAEDSEEIVEDEVGEALQKLLKDHGIEATPEQLNAFKELAVSATKNKGAQDSARNVKRVKTKVLKPKANVAKSKKLVMDAKAFKQAVRRARDGGYAQGDKHAIVRLRELEDAASVCRPILGQIRATAFDSADEIYQKAAITAGMKKHHAQKVEAARGYVIAELKHRGASNKRFAMDGTLKARNSSDRDMREFLKGIEV